jgi:hypothetical protein
VEDDGASLPASDGPAKGPLAAALANPHCILLSFACIKFLCFIPFLFHHLLDFILLDNIFFVYSQIKKMGNGNNIILSLYLFTVRG